jgi:hypothetical protein
MVDLDSAVMQKMTCNSFHSGFRQCRSLHLHKRKCHPCRGSRISHNSQRNHLADLRKKLQQLCLSRLHAEVGKIQFISQLGLPFYFCDCANIDSSDSALWTQHRNIIIGCAAFSQRSRLCQTIWQQAEVRASVKSGLHILFVSSFFVHIVSSCELSKPACVNTLCDLPILRVQRLNSVLRHLPKVQSEASLAHLCSHWPELPTL